MLWRRIADAAAAVGLDRARDAVAALWSAMGLDQFTEKTPARQRIAFTIAVVALAAKMAKADGIATDLEAAAFARHFEVAPAEMAHVKRVFALAAKDVAGYETYAEEIGYLLRDDPKLLRDVFECLFHIAAADGVLHAAEEAFLKTVAKKFGFDAAAFRTVRRLFVVDSSDPFEVLGVAPNVSDAQLKARHRKLVLENHPDQLAARGVPDDFRVLADRKLAAINAAYDAIREERKTVRPT